MGTPQFAADSLRALVDARHDVRGVVTRPDAAAGRGRPVRPSAVKALATELGLRVMQPAGVRSEGFHRDVAALAPDVVVVVAFGRILPRPLLDVAPLGAVNVHASLLPRYRGAAPIAWAIAGGERETGVTTQRMIERLDAGDILLQRAIPVAPDDTAATLERRLASLGSSVLVETLAGLGSGTIVPQPQDESLATHAPPLTKEDGRIDWGQAAHVIEARVRAFDPWPGAHLTLPRGGKRLIVWKARPEPGPFTREPGTVAEVSPEVVVACVGGEGLALLEVQPEGRRRMAGAAAAAGRYLLPGDRLGRP